MNKFQLLSSNLGQKTNEDEEVLGFLETDITNEAKRASRLVSHCFST